MPGSSTDGLIGGGILIVACALSAAVGLSDAPDAPTPPDKAAAEAAKEAGTATSTPPAATTATTTPADAQPDQPPAQPPPADDPFGPG